MLLKSLRDEAAGIPHKKLFFRLDFFPDGGKSYVDKKHCVLHVNTMAHYVFLRAHARTYTRCAPNKVDVQKHEARTATVHILAAI